jgi:AraC-like DNA-binding protein
MPSNTSKEIFDCIRFIRNRINDRISVDNVAALIDKSRAYTTKKFKAETGMTINEYILHRKMKEAKNMLRYSDFSIAEISSYLCFSSQSHFQNTFKAQCQMTPLEYRNNYHLT